ncbi:MAG TPA: dephospho-CoA kinase [Clostridiales bacterium]|nr:dephospho-CoA kinase [Clostridiales bacterium]
MWAEAGMKQSKRVIVITGGIGTGKSTAVSIIKNFGFKVIDSDKIVHEGYGVNSPLYKQVTEVFGKQILNEDCTINRQKLGKIVFNDNKKLHILNEIVHRYVLEELNKAINENDDEVIFLDIPLILENIKQNKYYELKFDEIWLIYVSPEIQIERLKKRAIQENKNPDDVLNIIKNEPSNQNNTEIQEKIVPFKGMRKVISDRMMESLHNMAQANHRMKVDMTEAIKLRKNLKESGINISYNDILIKIVSKALLEFPYMNSSLTGEGILLKDYVNIGLAVSVSNGLIVPNVKNAHKKSLEEIAAESRELIQKALNGSLSQEDYSGGTFTLSNLGMYDIDEFTAIINPPESGILAVGKVENTPVVENDTIVIKPIMTLSLTYDHRIIDGALAAQFLQRIKQLLMRPYLLL